MKGERYGEKVDDMLTLHETKLQSFSSKENRDLWGREHLKFIHNQQLEELEES